MLSNGRIELAPAPFLLLVMAALAIDMGLATMAVPSATHEVPLAEFFASALGVRLAFDLFVYSAAAGLFVVPIFAAVQAWAGEDRRARVVGAVNAMNYIGMVAGSIVAMILLQVVRAERVDGLHRARVRQLSRRRSISSADLPANTFAFVLRALWRVSVYGSKWRGRRTCPRPGEGAAIAINHVSFLDAPIVLIADGGAAGLRDRPRRGAAWLGEAASSASPTPGRWTRRTLDRSRAIAAARCRRAQLVDLPGRPHHRDRRSDARSMRRSADRIEKTEALVTPVRTRRARSARSSRASARPRSDDRFFPKIMVTILPPRRHRRPRAPRGRARRRAAGAALYDIMADLVFETTDIRRTLHEAFEAEARRTGLSRTVVEDPLAGPMSVRMFRIGVRVLARKIAAMSEARRDNRR